MDKLINLNCCICFVVCVWVLKIGPPVVMATFLDDDPNNNYMSSHTTPHPIYHLILLDGYQGDGRPAQPVCVVMKPVLSGDYNNAVMVTLTWVVIGNLALSSLHNSTISFFCCYSNNSCQVCYH